MVVIVKTDITDSAQGGEGGYRGVPHGLGGPIISLPIPILAPIAPLVTLTLVTLPEWCQNIPR